MVSLRLFSESLSAKSFPLQCNCMVTTALGLYNKDLNSKFFFSAFSLFLCCICKSLIGVLLIAVPGRFGNIFRKKCICVVEPPSPLYCYLQQIRGQIQKVNKSKEMLKFNLHMILWDNKEIRLFASLI